MPHQADDYGGVYVYHVTDQQYLAFVTCTVGPYWVEESIYLLDNATSPPSARQLAVPELTQEGAQGWVLQDVYLIHGLPTFDPDAKTLYNLVASRGLKDCGMVYWYRFEQGQFVLSEARHRECNDAEYVPSHEWELIYPQPTTAANGPWLLYKKELGGRQALVVADANGREQKIHILPDGAVVGKLAQAISADGKWLAFYTGSTEASYDLALNLMDLSNGQAHLLTPLLSASYPHNFRQAADLLSQQGIALIEGADSLIVSSFLQAAFIDGIYSLAWSPDGRYLAFAGQMDGPSSDLYVYDTETQAIQRLSDGQEQIQSIEWSLDGKWILHSSAFTRGEGTPINYYAVAVDGSLMRTLSSSILDIWGWIEPAIYLQSKATNGPAGTFDLQSVGIESGITTTLWGGTFESFALDPQNKLLAVCGTEEVGATSPRALFLVNLSNGSRRKIKEPASRVEFFGAGNKRFSFQAVEGDTIKTLFMLADGSIIESAYNAGRMTLSPDRRYLLVLGQAVQVYAIDGAWIQEIKLPAAANSVGPLVWRPDSGGFIFTLDSKLYAADLSAGQALLVDEGVPPGSEFDYFWTSR